MAGPAEVTHGFPWSLKPGDRVGRWRVVERLGAGSYGVVHRVEAEDRPGEFYALKLALRPSDIRAEREVALLSRTEHPHVVRVHDWGTWQGVAGSHLYFVMDWVQGLPLHTWVETANPPLRELARVAGTLALTLDWLHGRGVRHRDLKPEHILIRASDAQPVLIDFGVGRQEGASTLTSTVVPPGTLHLRSPEAVDFHRMNHREPGARYAFQPTDDLYALGVCLFRACTGHYPFPPDIPGDLLAMAILLHVPPPVAALNRRVPPALSEVVARLLEKKPQARYCQGRELHQALEAARALSPEQAWEETVFPWEEPPDAPGAKRALLPRVPMTPATPPPERDAPSTGGRRLGVVLLPPTAGASAAGHGVALLRLDTGAPPRERVAGRQSVSRFRRAAVAGVAMALALMAALVFMRGAGPAPSLFRGQEVASARAGSLEDEASREGVPSDEPPGAREAAAAPLVERPFAADAAHMTQPSNISEVKPSPSSSPITKPRPKTPATVRGALGAAAAVCVGAACSSPQPQQVEPARIYIGNRQILPGRRPPPEECPPGALDAMKELQFGEVGDSTPDASLPGFWEQADFMPVREGPVVLELDRQLGTLPRRGTTVSGRFFFSGGRVHGWFTEVNTKDGRGFPICMELLDPDRNQGWAQQGVGAEPGTVLVDPVGQLIRVKRFK